MTDDKRPREWTLYANGQWEGIGWEPRDEFVAIRVTVDKFAYDSLAKENKRLKRRVKVLEEGLASTWVGGDWAVEVNNFNQNVLAESQRIKGEK